MLDAWGAQVRDAAIVQCDAELARTPPSLLIRPVVGEPPHIWRRGESLRAVHLRQHDDLALLIRIKSAHVPHRKREGFRFGRCPASQVGYP
eukprot:CAMPEP_0171128728 /NCGR_PEP_ID=MMETSP0766_2-20121228/117642_1 /TAXON_ID=439317 /ORGANISM="Gambierdiscus australes, Strain CAWD 149" /LENGTH=90 /DNA_ID=CAMNT_0011591899 /DNA_START=140 /DNA_END=408 /DNA_ORIENTATION=+